MSGKIKREESRWVFFFLLLFCFFRFFLHQNRMKPIRYKVNSKASKLSRSSSGMSNASQK